MSLSDLPEPLRELVIHHLLTMDHVAVLIALHEVPRTVMTASEVAATTRLQSDVVTRALRDLTDARLLQAEGDGYSYDGTHELREGVDLLAEMNRTRPVTLVRAIYARPPRAAQSFADAFRIRKTGE